MKLSLPERGRAVSPAPAEASPLPPQAMVSDSVSPGATLATRLPFLTLLAVALLLLGSGAAILFQRAQEAQPVLGIVVEGATRYSAEEWIAASNLQRGGAVSNESLAAAEDRLRLHPAVQDVDIERRDSSLLIQIKERECAAVVRSELEPNLVFEIDPAGLILAENRLRCPNAPLLVGPFRREAESFTDPQLKAMLSDLQSLRETYPELARRISELRLRPEGGVALYLSPLRARVEVPVHFGETETLRRLYAAVAYFERNGVRQGSIDLRGPDAIVSTQP